jgi:16S rRNA processing protein RimM
VTRERDRSPRAIDTPRGPGREDDLDAARRLVSLGRITGPFGIAGWIKVHSDTEPRDNIVRYSPWLLSGPGRLETRRVERGRRHGKGVVAKLVGCDDRDAAESLRGLQIAVRRNQLPATVAEGEFYWADLEGLSVLTEEGVDLGRVHHLFETGANDVLVVRGERERLIPYLWQQVVVEVDLEAGIMRVDWDPEF